MTFVVRSEILSLPIPSIMSSHSSREDRNPVFHGGRILQRIEELLRLMRPNARAGWPLAGKTEPRLVRLAQMSQQLPRVL